MTVEEFAALGHEARPILDTVRAKCLDCCCNQRSEVLRCTAYGCPLWPFRMGTNPLRTPMSDERRAEAAVRMANARNKSRKDTGFSKTDEGAGRVLATSHEKPLRQARCSVSDGSWEGGRPAAHPALRARRAGVPVRSST